MSQLKSNFQLHLIQNQLNLKSFKRQFGRLVNNDDALLFLNDSVFVLLTEEFNSDTFKQTVKNVSVFILDEHIEARGVTTLVNSNIRPINYQQFVEHCQNADKIVSW